MMAEIQDHTDQIIMSKVEVVEQALQELHKDPLHCLLQEELEEQDYKLI